MIRLKLVTAAPCDESPTDRMDERGAPMAALVSTAEQIQTGHPAQAEVILPRVPATGVLGTVASRLTSGRAGPGVDPRPRQFVRRTIGGPLERRSR